LALRFQTDYAWSTKRLLRDLVLSSTYRQTSKMRAEILKRDPRNRLLASGPRFRLPAEIIRDQTLSLAGVLNLKMSGPPVRPPIPDGVWKPFDGRDKWENPQPDDESRNRRSIYTYTKRSIPFPMFASFDAPSREFCTPRRLRSNTPVQALMMLNDATFVDCAQALAKRMAAAADSLQDQVRHGFLLVTCREPSESELNDLVALAETPNADDATARLTSVAAVLLNLDEVITR
jgi:hypothetical protein